MRSAPARPGRPSTRSSPTLVERAAAATDAARPRPPPSPTPRRPPDARHPGGRRPPPRVRRQGAHRDPAPTGRHRQPRPRPVPDHGHLRVRLQRREPSARHGRRRLRRRPACRPTSRPTRTWPAAGLQIVEVDAGPGGGRGDAWPTARSTSWSSPRPIPRRRSGPASSRSSTSGRRRSTRSPRTTPGFLAAGMSSAVNREIIERAAEEGQGVRRGRRRSRRPRPIPPEVIAEPTRVRARQPGALASRRRDLLRSGRAGAHPPAPGRDPRRAVARARTDERRHRAVPDRTGQHERGPDRQGAGLRAARRRDRRADDRPAGRRLRRTDARAGSAVIVLAIALLLVASLGLGLFIAVVSDSERQAVQLSLLVLLASVFFSGFVLSDRRVHRAGPGAGLPACR